MSHPYYNPALQGKGATGGKRAQPPSLELNFMIDAELLKILVCPENKTPLTEVGNEVLMRANQLIETKQLKNRAGNTVDEKLDGGLLREDGAYLYAIRDDIPIMLIDEAIPYDQLR